jgi:hypothetical protein
MLQLKSFGLSTSAPLVLLFLPSVRLHCNERAHTHTCYNGHESA